VVPWLCSTEFDMDKRTRSQFEPIKNRIVAASKILGSAQYKILLEELSAEVEARLGALKEDERRFDEFDPNEHL
jgi:hypothetical protein